MQAIVTVVWLEIPESSKVITIAVKDKDEYDLLMSFHNRFINVHKDTDDIIEYFYDEKTNFRFIDEKGPVEMLGVEGAKFAVIVTGTLM